MSSATTPRKFTIPKERDTPSSTLYFCIAVSVRSLFHFPFLFEGSVGTGSAVCCCSPHFPSAAARSLPVAPTLFLVSINLLRKRVQLLFRADKSFFYYIARFFILFFQLFTKLPELSSIFSSVPAKPFLSSHTSFPPAFSALPVLFSLLFRFLAEFSPFLAAESDLPEPRFVVRFHLIHDGLSGTSHASSDIILQRFQLIHDVRF